MDDNDEPHLRFVVALQMINTLRVSVECVMLAVAYTTKDAQEMDVKMQCPSSHLISFGNKASANLKSLRVFSCVLPYPMQSLLITKQEENERENERKPLCFSLVFRRSKTD